MSICAICGKTGLTGVSQRHRRGVAGKRWAKRAQETKRLFKPNIQAKMLVINGVEQKTKICTKCLKRIKKFGKIKSFSNITVA